MMIWAGLAIQAGVFVVWTWLAYRSLFRLRAWAVRQDGQPFPGLAATLDAFGDFFRHPRFANDRRQLGLATLALVALSVLLSLRLPNG